MISLGLHDTLNFGLVLLNTHKTIVAFLRLTSQIFEGLTSDDIKAWVQALSYY